MRRIGVDLGGTKAEFILTTENPLEILERKRIPTQQELGYFSIVERLVENIQKLQEKCEDAPVIGIGIPGTLSPQDGLVKQSSTQCLIGKPLKNDLEEQIGTIITFENDANLFALSEALYGAGKGKKSVAGIILGTGMGGGIVFNGELWHGLQGLAGEWGHSSIDDSIGTQCWCGRKGCAELYLSGTGIQRLFQEATGESKTVQEIFVGYQTKQKNCIKIMQDVLVYFRSFYG